MRSASGMSGEVWPDGQSVIYQPLKLVQAFDVLAKYWADNEEGSG
jgi:hypothetical protein